MAIRSCQPGAHEGILNADVDDDSFAYAFIAVIIAAGIFKFVFHAGSEIAGGVIAIGCLAAPIENVTRARRKD